MCNINNNRFSRRPPVADLVEKKNIHHIFKINLCSLQKLSIRLASGGWWMRRETDKYHIIIATLFESNVMHTRILIEAATTNSWWPVRRKMIFTCFNILRAYYQHLYLHSDISSLLTKFHYCIRYYCDQNDLSLKRKHKDAQRQIVCSESKNWSIRIECDYRYDYCYYDTFSSFLLSLSIIVYIQHFYYIYFDLDFFLFPSFNIGIVPYIIHTMAVYEDHWSGSCITSPQFELYRVPKYNMHILWNTLACIIHRSKKAEIIGE